MPLPDHVRMQSGRMGSALGDLWIWVCRCGAAELSTSQATADVLWIDHAPQDSFSGPR